MIQTKTKSKVPLKVGRRIVFLYGTNDANNELKVGDIGTITDLTLLSRDNKHMQLMKRSAREKLGGKALLSQDYYTLAYMLSNFIYELIGEKMLDPDDTNDGTRGEWKKEIYSDPFDYDARKTRNIIPG